MKNKIVITIEARMGSARLPGKTLKKLGKYTVLEYMIHRLKRSKLATDICLATTNSPKDDPIIELADKINLKYYRGSETDVLGRVYETASNNRADVIVETTADCPMIDAGLIDEGISLYLSGNYDCIGVGSEKSYPEGLDFYIVGYKSLKEANEKANTSYQREHVVEYIASHPADFKCLYIQAPEHLNRLDVRITVDNKEDLDIMNKIAVVLGEDRFDYTIDEIIKAWDLIKAGEKKL